MPTCPKKRYCKQKIIKQYCKLYIKLATTADLLTDFDFGCGLRGTTQLRVAVVLVLGAGGQRRRRNQTVRSGSGGGGLQKIIFLVQLVSGNHVHSGEDTFVTLAFFSLRRIASNASVGRSFLQLRKASFGLHDDEFVEICVHWRLRTRCDGS